MSVVRSWRLTWLFLGVVLAGAKGYPAAPAVPEPRPEQVLYWWQDELRTVAHELSIARTGSVAQWPRMSVPAGSAVLPLPRPATAIQADGRLDEPAWKQATSFPVGPIFDDWRSGPFSIQVSACRDENRLYLAIESPRELSGLGSLAPNGELFSVDEEGFRLSPDGGLAPECAHWDGQRQVVELALPLAAEPRLSFAVETLRRTDGKLPHGAELLGLDKQRTPPPARKPAANRGAAGSSALEDPSLPLWLQPMTVRLVPADAAVQVKWVDESQEHRALESRVVGADLPEPVPQFLLDLAPDVAVVPFACRTTAAGKPWSLEGFVYREPVRAAWEAAHAIGGRADRGQAEQGPAFGARGPRLPVSRPESWDAAARKAWRDAFCLARQLRARAQLSLLDAPLLFVKQHPYFAGHVYDDFYPVAHGESRTGDAGRDGPVSGLGRSGLSFSDIFVEGRRSTHTHDPRQEWTVFLVDD